MIEAIMFEPTPVEEYQITESNDCFANELGLNIHLSVDDIHAKLQSGLYAALADTNAIAKYNMIRLHFLLQ